MQFRCFRCGFVMADGMPPIEALSQTQSEVVGSPFQGDLGDVLTGTYFDGMSMYSFCTFCAFVLVHFNFLFTDKKAPHLDFNQQRLGDPKVPGGDTLISCKDCSWQKVFTGPGTKRWITINRSMWLHYVHESVDYEQYRNELSELSNLLHTMS